MIDLDRYDQTFQYLSAEDLPTGPEPGVVFGRNDRLVSEAAGELAAASLIEILAISGGVGKDTGDLLERGYHSEADFLWDDLVKGAALDGYVLPEALLDERAMHRRENAQFSLAMLRSRNIAISSLTAVAHATSAKGLAEVLRFEADSLTGNQTTVHVKPTRYEFNKENPADQAEAAAELLRLFLWPDRKLLYAQPDLPEDLVEFALDNHQQPPLPPSSLVCNTLRLLPPQQRVKAITWLAKR